MSTETNVPPYFHYDVSYPKAIPCHFTSIYKYKIQLKNYRGNQIQLCHFDNNDCIVIQFVDKEDYHRAHSIYNDRMKPKLFTELSASEKLDYIKLLKKN
jgi:hypothetical protein